MTGCPFVISIHLLKINPNGVNTYKITIFSIQPKYLFPIICNINFTNISNEIPIKIKNKSCEIIKSNIIFYLYFSSEEIDLILKLKIHQFLTLNTFNPKDNGLFPAPQKEENYSILMFCTYYATIEKNKQIKATTI